MRRLVVGLLRERAPLADEERRGDGARLARLGRHDPLHDRRADLARPRGRSKSAAAPPRASTGRARSRCRRSPSKKAARCAIVAARHDRAGHRHQPGVERHAAPERRQPVASRQASREDARASPPARCVSERSWSSTMRGRSSARLSRLDHAAAELGEGTAARSPAGSRPSTRSFATVAPARKTASTVDDAARRCRADRLRPRADAECELRRREARRSSGSRGSRK